MITTEEVIIMGPPIHDWLPKMYARKVNLNKDKNIFTIAPLQPLQTPKAQINVAWMKYPQKIKIVPNIQSHRLFVKSPKRSRSI